MAALGDSDESRQIWSFLIAKHLGRDRFGKLPIVPYTQVQSLVGSDDLGEMLDRFQADGECDPEILAELGEALEGKARFLVLGNIREDRVDYAETESEVVDEKTKDVTKTKKMTTTRTTSVGPPTPDLEKCLSYAFDDVGAYLKPKKKK